MFATTDHYKRKCTTYIFTNCSVINASYEKSTANDLPRPSTVRSFHCSWFFLAVCIVISTWKRKEKLWSCVLFLPATWVYFLLSLLACAAKHQVYLSLPVRWRAGQHKQRMVLWMGAIVAVLHRRCSHTQSWLLVIETHQCHSTPSHTVWIKRKR